MNERRPFFRADHVGSLLRPEPLAKAREQARSGQISAEQLRKIQDKHVAEAIRRHIREKLDL